VFTRWKTEGRDKKGKGGLALNDQRKPVCSMEKKKKEKKNKKGRGRIQKKKGKGSRLVCFVKGIKKVEKTDALRNQEKKPLPSHKKRRGEGLSTMGGPKEGAG